MKRIAIIAVLLSSIAAYGVWADAQLPAVRNADTAPYVLPPIKSGDTITLPDGEVTITAPLRVDDVDNAVIRGGKDTRVTYRGPPTKGMVTFIRASRCELRDVTLLVGSDGVDAAVLHTEKPGPNPTGRVSTGCRVLNVKVFGTDGHRPRRAFSADTQALGGLDKNNDLIDYTDCIAFSYAEAGFYVDGTQCHQMTYHRSSAVNFTDKPNDRVGWHFKRGVFFAARDCGGNRNAVDFRLGDQGISARIENFNSEHSRQFLALTSQAYSEYPVVVDGGRIDAEPDAGRPLIDAHCVGPLTIRGVLLTSLNGQPPRIRLTSPVDWTTGTARSVPGTADLSSILFTQIGGPPPVKDLCTAPPTWALRDFGLLSIHVPPQGPRARTRVTPARVGR